MSYQVVGDSVQAQKQPSTVDPNFHPEIGLPGVAAQIDSAGIMTQPVDKNSQFMGSLDKHKWLILGGLVLLYLSQRKRE